MFAKNWLTVFLCSSSGASRPFSSNFFSRFVAICSYVPFSKWTWFIDFFRCGGILAYMKYSIMAWVAIPNAFLVCFWSSSGKSINFCFAGFKTNFWNLLLPSLGVLQTFFKKFPGFLSNSLRLGHYCFQMFLTHLLSKGNGSNWFCHLQSADYDFWGSFGKDLQTARTSQFSRQMLAALWQAILATWKFCWYCYGKLKNCCCLPTAEGPTKFVFFFDRCRGTLTADLRLTERVVLFLLSWGCTGGALGDFLVNSCHHVVADF